MPTYQKGSAVSVSSHFNSNHFDCHCKRPECNSTIIDENLPHSLDLLWDISGPFKIDSGFRCQAHNAEIGGAKHSKHLLGQAADCKSLEGLSGTDMAKAAEKVFLFNQGGIGTYPTFSHCDVRADGMARWKSGMKASQIISC